MPNQDEPAAPAPAKPGLYEAFTILLSETRPGEYGQIVQSVFSGMVAGSTRCMLCLRTGLVHSAGVCPPPGTRPATRESFEGAVEL